MSYSVSHSSRIWDLAAVCWELIDSASPRAKGPAMVLSLCPACSGAGGGWTGTRGPGGEDGGLARGHGAKRGGGGGRFGRGDGQMPEQQPALEVTHPLPTSNRNLKPSAGGPDGTLCGVGAFQCPSFSWHANWRHAGSQNPIFGFIFHHQWNGILWRWNRASVYQAAQLYSWKPQWKLTYRTKKTLLCRSQTWDLIIKHPKLFSEDRDNSWECFQHSEPQSRNSDDFCLFCFGQASGFAPGRIVCHSVQQFNPYSMSPLVAKKKSGCM